MRVVGNFNRVKLHSTTAMSLLAGSETNFDRAALKAALEGVAAHAASDPRPSLLSDKSTSSRKTFVGVATTDDDAPFGEQLCALTQRLVCDF